MKNKIIRITAVLLATLALASCSAVFDAGVSGSVYYYNGETKTYVSGAKVSVYADSSGSNLLASTTTDGNGSYTVSRVVWSTSSPAFGKTADYTTIYIQVTHDDYATSDLTAVKIVSDSTNGSQGDVQLTRTRFDMPTFSGKIYDSVTTDSTSITLSDYDNVQLLLCYDKDGTITPYTDSAARVKTTNTQISVNDPAYVYSHGNFSGLGGSSIKWEGTPGDDNYARMTVYIVIDADGDGVYDSGEKKAAVEIQSGTTAYTQLTESDFDD